MKMNINGRNAQGEALPKVGKRSLSSLQKKAHFDTRRVFNELVAVLTGGEG